MLAYLTADRQSDDVLVDSQIYTDHIVMIFASFNKGIAIALCNEYLLPNFS